MSDVGQRAARAVRFLHQEHEILMKTWRAFGPEDDALKAASHALHWAYTADDILRYASYPGQHLYRSDASALPELAGMEYARNHAAHHGSDLVRLVDGAQLPAPLPCPLYDITWAPLPPLPGVFERQNAANRAAFEKHLEGNAVRFALQAVLRFFDERVARL